MEGNTLSTFDVKDEAGKPIFTVAADYNAVVLRNKKSGDMVWIHADPSNGGSGIDLRDQNGTAGVLLDADHKTIVLRDQKGTNIIALDANNNTIWLANKQGYMPIWLHADPANGGSGIELRNQIGTPTIQLDGDNGDIRLLNADCAEDFEIMAEEPTECGTVMSLNDLGQLEMSRIPYDKRVAGVVSGGGNLKPGLILDRQAKCKDRLPIALMGKVHCKVDADYGSIGVGDLLTTSSTPGYAMKASDPAKSFGAVIGKALRPLKAGHDLIPILVALQ
jgi:hypothetical protein